MSGIPQRHSLVAQTVAWLRGQIAAGQWRDWLPAERALCDSLQVSRSTLRRALVELKREKLVRAEHGAGNRIIVSDAAARSAVRQRAATRTVALLSPEPLELLRPTQALWIDELRAMLAERGCRLQVFHGRQYFRAKPEAALARLVRQHPHTCWILTLTNAAAQRWFARREALAIVAGSCHAGVDLPFRDLDHRAMCRHAAGVLLALGHRRLALLAQKTPLAGDLESEAGFMEGVAQSRQAGAHAIVAHHDATVGGLSNALRRLFAAPEPPTALLVANAYHYLTVATRLLQLGQQVPRDVSLISRDEDPFLSFVLPAPARYVASPRTFAKSLLQPVLELLEDGAVSQRAHRLMPEFMRGESVGPAK